MGDLVQKVILAGVQFFQQPVGFTELSGGRLKLQRFLFDLLTIFDCLRGLIRHFGQCSQTDDFTDGDLLNHSASGCSAD